jgi:hypothetical protein
MVELHLRRRGLPFELSDGASAKGIFLTPDVGGVWIEAKPPGEYEKRRTDQRASLLYFLIEGPPVSDGRTGRLVPEPWVQ